ncbi:MAG: putative porin [Saprospiraceae bacterium]|nr:putative porin [Saprospiraceae bacterium]MCF8251443.1 putative porin [Saprospiraceae bacterium]MCF8282571.1 putative porin [Bacteroidales bacterium]MCF8313038.1 putative porin [Saprospiraceae bacterium]MCF8441485.1 putative porin [Saprospiraceae bacterium]
MKQLPFYILLIFSGLFVEGAAAQFGGGGGGLGGVAGKFGGSGGGGSGVQRLALDTSDIFFFYADEPNLVFPFSDSLLSSVHQYDPIRQQEYDFANLGNLGSAARPLFFQPTWRRGFDVGLHQFDIYQTSTADIRYYKITQAYTKADFSKGATQNDAQFNVQFSRNFADGLNFSIEHRRINNLGAYDTQKATTSSVATGMWYHPKKGNYDVYFSFVSNSIEQQDNGGAAEDLSTAFFDAYQVDVHLANANTRYANRELAYTQYIRLNGRRKVGSSTVGSGQSEPGSPKDSLSTRLTNSSKIDSASHRPSSTASNPQSAIRNPQPKRAFTLYHQIAWHKDSYKFSDTSPDSTFYGDFMVDKRGLRHYLEVRKLENTFKLQTFKLHQQTTDSTSNRALPKESDLLEIGLVHRLNFLKQEPVDTGAIQNLFLTARLNFSPGDRLRLNTYAHLGIGANAGDYRVSGELFLNLKKIGTLRLEAVNQLYSPSLLPQRFYVTQEEMWKNDFGKTLETSLSGTYSLPQFKFSVGGKSHLLNNLVYFDEAGRPQQSGTFSILQLTAKKDFTLGPLHLDNSAYLQQTTSDVLPLPQFYSKHSLFLEGKIFKKVMLTKIGVDARLTAAYTPPSYNPLIGQFELQDTQSLPFTPLLDAFLSVRVKTFRFFFKIENVLATPLRTYYYQTADYPMPFGYTNGGMRLGISWRLVD